MEEVGIKQEKQVPTTLFSVDGARSNWACMTHNLLDSQHISWTVCSDSIHTVPISAINYGTVSIIDNIKYNDGSVLLGSIFIEPIEGEYSYTDVVLHKGNIKHLTHRKDKNIIWDRNGDLFLKIHAIVSMHFNKHTGYICFGSKGRTIISMSLFLDKQIIGLYPDNWITNINNIYNGRNWK